MQFETITYSDLDEIRNLQPDDWGDIIPDIEFYLRSSFCNPVKATIDGIIVGTGTAIVFENTAWIAHIIVGSRHRNKGIGGQIVNYLLELLKKDSIETCSLIATSLGKPVYIKSGFSVVSEYLFFKREKPRVTCALSKNLIPFAEVYRSEIYKLDAKISGENRVRLLENMLEKSILYVDKNKVLGYYIPELKEGLIFADTEEAGLELMRLKYSTVDKAVLPSENTAGREFLIQNGFVQISIGTRMVLGKEIAWKPEKMYSRIGGNLG